mmetsp:Transcript_66277/g.213628  ORF Transcript_66277/g.213628 Transcript_66277/m.213628 type:complete len:275 (-) Transcript_66277:436-1260(-)
MKSEPRTSSADTAGPPVLPAALSSKASARSRRLAKATRSWSFGGSHCEGAGTPFRTSMGAPPPGVASSRKGLSVGTGSEVSTFRRRSCARRSRPRSWPAPPRWPTSVACAQQSGRSASFVTLRPGSSFTSSSKACDMKQLTLQLPAARAAAGRKPASPKAALHTATHCCRRASSQVFSGRRPAQNEEPRPTCFERLCLRLALAGLVPTRPLEGRMVIFSNALSSAPGARAAGSTPGGPRQQDFRFRRCLTIASSSSETDMVSDVSGSLSVTSVR